MGGLALLARSLGHRVTGSDEHVYPPMSTLLQQQGVEIGDGYEPAHLQPAPELVVVGNAMSRGRPIIEYLLDSDIDWTSGPQWFGENVLRNRSVIAVAGTHGKTTTSSMLAWILDQAGADPGFLIGGVPPQLEVSARLGSGPWFVVEADEYDTAFFDKRSKFVHYRPDIAILNNLEFDHADIFENLAAIEKQFHHFIRTIPPKGRIVANADDQNIFRVLDQGCWTPVQYFCRADQTPAVSASSRTKDAVKSMLHSADGSRFEIHAADATSAMVEWTLIGNHNVANGLAATVAAQAAGVSLDAACRALCEFQPSRRRLELIADAGDIKVYDDFAHHPTAVETTLKALRANSPDSRLVAVVELRSNTMQMGIHHDELLAALQIADVALVYTAAIDTETKDGADLSTTPDITKGTQTLHDYAVLEKCLKEEMTAGDQIVFMSNGSFDGIAQRISLSVQGLA